MRNECFFFLPRHSFDMIFSAHSLLLCDKGLIINQFNGTPCARVFCAGACVMRFQPLFKLIGPAAIKAAVGAFQDIRIIVLFVCLVHCFPLSIPVCRFHYITYRVKNTAAGFRLRLRVSRCLQQAFAFAHDGDVHRSGVFKMKGHQLVAGLVVINLAKPGGILFVCFKNSCSGIAKPMSVCFAGDDFHQRINR